MITIPAVFAYVSASVIAVFFTLGSTFAAIGIMVGWDRSSGSETQIRRERRTYLVSTIMTVVMSFELLSLFFFVAIADQLHVFFTGAMCAAGTLLANSYGYPTLVLKILSFLACGFWLTLNHLDSQFYDYPLLRVKYSLLLPICLLIICETISGALFFTGLDPQIITSCCGVIFDANSIAPELPNFPVLVMRTLFFIVLAGVLGAGFYFTGTGRGDHWFGLMNLTFLPVSLAAVISFFCLYFYELPTHHCPFCLLHREYNYVGYFLYLSIFFGTLMGTGVGTIGVMKRYCPLKDSAVRIQRRLCLQSIIANSIFAFIACYPMLFSDFRL